MSFIEFRTFIDDQLGVLLTIFAILVAIFAWIFPQKNGKNKLRIVILIFCIIILGLLVANHFSLSIISQPSETLSPDNNPDNNKEPPTPPNDNLNDAILAFKNKEFYSVETYNTDKFSLTVEKQGLFLFANDVQMWGQGFYPSEDIPIDIYIVKYDTEEVVSHRQSFIGETNRFTELYPGTYFYIILASGYLPSYPVYPFTLNESYEQNELPNMTAFLEEIGFKENPLFDVKVIDLHGDAISDTEFELRIAESNNPNPSYYTHVTAKTDENGYLVPLWTSNPFNYETKYTLARNCILQLSIDGFNFFDAVPTDNCHYIVKID